jgi:predicted nucleic acid-binding protein
VILVDTSVLVDALSSPERLAATLTAATRRGERLGLCAPVLYEWLRGPRTPAEIEAQEALFPAAAIWPFGAAEARRAAELYRHVPRARQREFDLAVAACALTREARLWTLNPADFRDIPGLTLYRLETR